MISTNAIADSIAKVFGHFAGTQNRRNANARELVWERTRRAAAPATVAEHSVMVRTADADGTPAIAVAGALDASICDTLIQEAAALYAAGAASLVFDLSDVERVSLCGIYALHAVAAIYRHAAAPDAFSCRTNDLPALRRLAEANLTQGRVPGMHIVCSNVELEAKLSSVGIHQVFTLSCRG